MTRRATFTQTELARAIRAADDLGKVALWTAAGIAFVGADQLHLSPLDPPRRNTCDEAFGTAEAVEVAECDRAFGVVRSRA